MLSSLTCPKCGAPTPVGAKLCSYCGSRVGKSRPAGARRRLVGALIALAVVALAVAAVVLDAPSRLRVLATGDKSCPRYEVNAYADQALPILSRWMDAKNRLLSATTGTELSEAVTEMESLRAEYEGLRPPPCLSVAHRNMSGSMFDVIVALHGAGTGGNPKHVEQLVKKAASNMTWALQTIERVQKEAR